MRKGLKTGVLTVVVLFLVQFATAFAGDNDREHGREHLVVPPNERAYGKTYDQWGDAWYVWLFSVFDKNPFDSGDCLTTNQNQKVFFLVGTGGGDATRTCNIKAGTPLFFPIINQAYLEDPSVIDPSFHPPYVPATWLSWVKEAMAPNNVRVQAWIDGNKVEDLKEFRATSNSKTPFPVNIPAFGISNWLGVQAGYYLLLRPLLPGHHTIEFTGEQINTIDIKNQLPPAIIAAGGTTSIPAFSLHVKYDITVSH